MKIELIENDQEYVEAMERLELITKDPDFETDQNLMEEFDHLFSLIHNYEIKDYSSIDKSVFEFEKDTSIPVNLTQKIIFVVVVTAMVGTAIIFALT